MGSEDCSYIFNTEKLNADWRKVMNQSPQRYQEISLADLFWYICSSWRVLVAGMLVCAILTGCYRVYKNNSGIAAAQAELETQKNAEETGGNPAYDALTESEAAAVDNAVEYARWMKLKQNYKNSSVYINLDPYHENVKILNYIVQTDRDAVADDGMSANTFARLVVQSYTNYLNSGAAAAKIADVSGKLDKTNVSELISAGQLEGATAFKTGNFTTEGNVTSFREESDKAYELFTVRVKGSTDNEAEELAKALEQVLDEYTQTLTETLAPHTLTCHGSSAGVVVDTDLATQKQNFQTEMTNIRTNLDNIVNAMTEEQKAAYEKIVSRDAGEEPDQETGKEPEEAGGGQAPAFSASDGLVKYVLFGLVIGLFLAAMVLALVYVMGPALKTTEDFTRCFGYYLMADMSCHRSLRKRFGAGVDRLINRLRYRGRLSAEEEQRLLATNLKVTCQKEGLSSVYLTSSYVMCEEEERMVAGLVQALKKENITASYGRSIERDAESYENMTKTGAVVYVEKLGVSRFASLENIHAMTEKQGVKILGVVAV